MTGTLQIQYGNQRGIVLGPGKELFYALLGIDGSAWRLAAVLALNFNLRGGCMLLHLQEDKSSWNL